MRIARGKGRKNVLVTMDCHSEAEVRALECRMVVCRARKKSNPVCRQCAEIASRVREKCEEVLNKGGEGHE
jgi:hypothetical protein